jgi:hypothetical protein
MNNEPVAWVELEAWESGKYPPDDCFAEHPFQNAIPLYTHPVKDLTAEEINKIYLEKYDGHMGFLSPDEVREFARAILRKAQEKC